MTDKAKLKEAYLEGYSEGRGVESMSDVSIRTAEAKFQRWWEINDMGENDTPGSLYPAAVVDEDA